MTPLQFKYPTAFLPAAMSSLAIVVVMAHFLAFGRSHDQDEGAAAHIYQLLVTVQIPIIARFSWKRVRGEPKKFLTTLLVQATLWLFAIASVPLFT